MNMSYYWIPCTIILMWDWRYDQRHLHADNGRSALIITKYHSTCNENGRSTKTYSHQILNLFTIIHWRYMNFIYLRARLREIHANMEESCGSESQEWEEFYHSCKGYLFRVRYTKFVFALDVSIFSKRKYCILVTCNM